MHIYKVSRDGKNEQLLTKGNFDADMTAYDATGGNIYFIASPYDATQKYLYRINLNNTDTVRVTPAIFDGTNNYRLSPDAKYATHVNANINRNYNIRLVSLPTHQKVYPSTDDKFSSADLGFKLEKFKVKTADGIEMDGIMAKPNNFDPNKKYPVYFYVYGEPAATTADDVPNFDNFISQLIPEGYIGITMDNRGTPAYKGREWRKSIYKKIGVINSHDQAMAAKEVLKWNFIDTSRVAVHGWSGGAAMTLNLMFRYPEIYKTGIAVAAVTDQRFYDNIYTERYMGLPQENADDYTQASPITFAKNLRGNLLYMHGTGDDNVHYKNAEVLINELIKDGKLFQFMAYPNRTHGIFEGPGTSKHLNDTFIKFLREHCPPGAK
jgi:dipeptidyl-peptidase-4